ncbi:hypothetical protein [Flagellimonas onchidii]|uniref:hypothetical protein n=1 Tax=Flagellimonas onchidii TaxID=2562684 RepID=UPI0010A6A71D|nr:hypothetical protein [Allomuricauda onchidii]
MAKHEEFNLKFVKIQPPIGSIRYSCTQDIPDSYATLVGIIPRISAIECEALIEEIENAENGAYYEQYFSLDASAASDDDGIEINPPNVVFNSVLSIPFADAKMLIQEWLDFLNT